MLRGARRGSGTITDGTLPVGEGTKRYDAWKQWGTGGKQYEEQRTCLAKGREFFLPIMQKGHFRFFFMLTKQKIYLGGKKPSFNVKGVTTQSSGKKVYHLQRGS